MEKSPNYASVISARWIGKGGLKKEKKEGHFLQFRDRSVCEK
jgi:hypothetical protein